MIEKYLLAAATAGLLTFTPTGIVQKDPLTLTAVAKYTNLAETKNQSLGFLGIPLGFGGDPNTIIKSVQAVVITISASSLSNTALISSVSTGRTEIIHAGFSYNNASTEGGHATATLVLTSATVVTATREGTTGDLVVRGYAVEYQAFAIQSVQSGTIILSGVATNTASISSVNTSYAYIRWGGRSKNTAATQRKMQIRLSFASSTSVQADCEPTGSSATVAFTVVEFKPSILNSTVQAVSITLTSTASNTAAISAVTPAQTMLVFSGYSDSNSATGPNVCATSISISSSTVVTGKRASTGSATSIINGFVVEFKSKYVQQTATNLFNMNATTQATAAISAANLAKSVIGYCGVKMDTGSTDWRQHACNVNIDSTTQVSGNMNSAGSSGNEISGHFIEFK